MKTPSSTPSRLDAHIEVRNAKFTQNNPQAVAEHYLGTVLKERAPRYAAHVATMALTADQMRWSMFMSKTFGPHPTIHHYVCNDWLEALLIARYGEEPDAEKSTDVRVYVNPQEAAANGGVAADGVTTQVGQRVFKGWPTTLTDGDMQVAQKWMSRFGKHGAILALNIDGQGE